MKKTLVAIVLLFSLFGCKKIDELTQFNMDYNASIVVPASSGLNIPFNVFTPEIESNSESTFSVNNTNKDLIESIVLTKCALTHTSPTDGDFSFLNSIEVYIKANGLPEIKVAFKNDIPAEPGKLINLQTTGEDLKDYIKADEFSLRVRTITDELISSDQNIDIASKFFVDAKILGQ